MKLAALHLRQRDGVSCGPAVAVVAGALVDPTYCARLTSGRDGAAGRAWFDWEQGRVHRAANRLWPRGLGTTPWGIAWAISVHSARRGVRYRWRPCWRRHDGMADVLGAVDAQWPVAMLVGNVIPRHWVLLVDRDAEAEPGVVQCYEPSSGQVRKVELSAIRGAALTNVGFPRPFAFVLPRVTKRISNKA